MRQTVKTQARAGSGALRRAPLYVLAGTIVGFATVIGLHGQPASPLAASPPAAGAGSGTGNGNAGSQRAGSMRTAVGTSVNFGYGTIAVKVTVRGKHIIGISVASVTTLEPTSQQISAQAIPLLRSEVLAAQSANISGVSGASYTSAGYAQSLQAALDELHVK
jgi:uncharacterized protein with FMN-binding domain